MTAPLDTRMSALHERLGAAHDAYRTAQRDALEEADDEVLSTLAGNITDDLATMGIDYRRFQDAARIRIRWEAAVVLRRREYQEARDAVIAAGGIWCLYCKQDRAVCKGEHVR